MGLDGDRQGIGDEAGLTKVSCAAGVAVKTNHARDCIYNTRLYRMADERMNSRNQEGILKLKRPALNTECEARMDNTGRKAEKARLAGKSREGSTGDEDWWLNDQRSHEVCGLVITGHTVAGLVEKLHDAKGMAQLGDEVRDKAIEAWREGTLRNTSTADRGGMVSITVEEETDEVCVGFLVRMVDRDEG